MFETLIDRLRPDLKDRAGLDRTAQLINVYTVLYANPFILVGLVWLWLWTDFAALRQNAALLFILLVISMLFRRFSFTLQFQVRPGVYASSGGSFSFLVSLSAVLIFGPTGYWISVATNILDLVLNLRQNRGTDGRWAQLSTFSIGTASGLIAALTAFGGYQAIGGTIPLANLAWINLWPSIVFIAIYWLLPYLISLPLLVFLTRSPDLLTAESITPGQFIFSLVVGSMLPNLGLPFTLLGAVLYTQQGFGVFLFFLTGVLLASALSSRLSDNVQQRASRAREMGVLEELGRTILVNEPNLDALTQVLPQHVSTMFIEGRLFIWIYPDRTLHKSTHYDDPNIEEIQEELKGLEAETLPIRPFESATGGRRIGVTVPIKTDVGEVIGGISFNLSANNQDLEDFVPALQSLAAQISSALYRYQAHEEALRNERMTSELEIAGRIQANFLPEDLPNLAGYQIAASLTPARQTSGDYYDFIPLPGGSLGVLVADVADKGAGAALFMALSRTLIRSYALEYPDEPEKVVQMANQRILADTQSALFVTGFYAVINPETHQMTYVNAGHNPPYLINNDKPIPLTRTGIPLGIFEDAVWENRTISLHPGGSLTVFTDGITEAQNNQDEEYSEERLLEVLMEYRQSHADEMLATVLRSVNQFAGEAPQTDDLTIIVVKRIT